MKHWTPLLVAALVVPLARPVKALQSEPDDILYGYLASDGDSAFARYEFRWQQGSLQIAFAPYGHTPAPLEDLRLSDDHGRLSFLWPDGAACELERRPTEGWSYEGLVPVQWAGSCATAEGGSRQISVGMDGPPDFGQHMPAGEEDVRIIDHAIVLLEDADAWNSSGDRVCEDDDRHRSWSLFCALWRASLDITGEYQHARRAMDLVRVAVRESTGLSYVHTLRDYNNHPETTVEDVRTRLREGRAKVVRELSNPFGTARAH